MSILTPKSRILTLDYSEDSPAPLGIHSDQVQGVQYFTLFNKTLRKPNPVDFEPKKQQKVAKTPTKQVEVAPYKRRNVQLDTVLGKLLNSYAIQLSNKYKPGGKLNDPKMEKSQSSNMLLYNNEDASDQFFNFRYVTKCQVRTQN